MTKLLIAAKYAKSNKKGQWQMRIGQQQHKRQDKMFKTELTLYRGWGLNTWCEVRVVVVTIFKTQIWKVFVRILARPRQGFVKKSWRGRKVKILARQVNLVKVSEV